MQQVFLIPVVVGLLLIQSCNRNEDPPGMAVKASFSISGFEFPSPTTITFINTSQNATAYTWSFGDGSTSAEFNPTHSYNTNGSYLLKLKVTGPGGTDSVCKLVAIEAPPAVNRSAFSYLAEKCTGTPVAFSFKTINPLSTNTVWDFGNGIINVSRDPIIQFVLPGDYTIKYSSQINGVRDTVTRIIQIF
ncbi:MAG: PKD domain-containing protein [Chitinophagaceae bacterium]|nr:PKD domain-containing protein [Chitinophagaceae bacterium]